MNEFVLEFEWIDQGPLRGIELRETFARLSIRIKGDPVTLVLHEPSQTVRRSVYEPLYPLAEWIVANWWQLLCEGSSRRKKERDAWRARHSLLAASEGYALPNCEIWREGQWIHCRWCQHEAAGQRVTFLSQGHERLPVGVVEEGLRQFVEAVLERLLQRNVKQTFLEDEWQAICGVTNNERDFCKSAAKIGLDPYDMSESMATALERAKRDLGPTLLGDFLQVADSAEFENQLNWLQQERLSFGNFSDDVQILHELRNKLAKPDTQRPPWRIGYDCAEELRKNAKVTSGSEKTPFESLFGASDVVDKLTQVVSRPGPRQFHALLGLGPADGPVVILQRQRTESKRFAFCRALFHYLFDKDSLALVTDANDDRQKSNRAFSAELLAPAEQLKGKLSEPIVSPDEIDALAADFGVSTWVIKHQIKNHHLAELSPVP